VYKSNHYRNRNVLVSIWMRNTTKSYERVCAFCGGRFIGIRSHAKYCCDSHRAMHSRANRAMIALSEKEPITIDLLEDSPGPVWQSYHFGVYGFYFRNEEHYQIWLKTAANRNPDIVFWKVLYAGKNKGIGYEVYYGTLGAFRVKTYDQYLKKMQKAAAVK
jgi:hypothetical protein